MKNKPAYSDLKYSIRILNNGDDSYSVEVPKLPECYSAGKTKDQCLANIIEAIELHVDGLKRVPPEDPMPSIEVEHAAPSADDYLISLAEACKFIDVSDSTIRRYINDGKIPAYTFGKEYKFKIHELTKFIDSHRVDVRAAKAKKLG